MVSTNHSHLEAHLKPVSFVNDPARGVVLSLDGTNTVRIEPKVTTDPDTGVVTTTYPFLYSIYNFSLGFWFKTSQSAGTQFLFDNRNPSNLTRDFSYIKMDNGIITAEYTTDFGGACLVSLSTGSTSYADGQWHHLAWIRDKQRTGKLYIDGVLVQEDTINTGCSANGSDPRGPVYLGSNQGTTDFFVGELDSFYYIWFTNQIDFLDLTDINTLIEHY